ncbi:MAG: hypothetical protein AYK19_05480 [Theionarchaea archaeon DG-70-1]|nr:MAG: hypothetical protein AYK19_05480 [Theionarchaea archaeon DG-70-1]
MKKVSGKKKSERTCRKKMEYSIKHKECITRLIPLTITLHLPFFSFFQIEFRIPVLFHDYKNLV